MGTITKINAGGSDHYIASTAYAICNTAAATAAKTANLIGDQDDSASTAAFTLIKGTTVHVKFVNGNTVEQPTLSIGGSAAAAIIGDITDAGLVVMLTYDGTSWVTNTSMSVSSDNIQAVVNEGILSFILGGGE